jgi:hypothetical protein
LIQRLRKQFRDAVRIVISLAEGQELAAGSRDIYALAWQSLVVGPLFGDLPEELHVGRPWGLGPLITLDLIGRRDEVPREFLEAWVRPDKLSVE